MITSSWESPVTTWTPHNHPVQLQVSFDGSRLVFHGSMSVFLGFQGFRLVFHVSRSVFMFFKVPGWFSMFNVSFSWFPAGFSRFQIGFMVIHGSRPAFMVPGWFLWLIKTPGWSFMVPGIFFGYSRFQFGCSWLHVGFYIFLRFQVGFFMAPGRFSWFFKIPDWFLMVVFHGFFYGSRSGLHDSRWILPSSMVPGWF